MLAPIVSHGYRNYLRRGSTSPLAYSAMRRLFAGADPDCFERLVARSLREGPLLEVDDSSGLVAGAIDDATTSLRRDGLAVLPGRLPEPTCAALEALALQSWCTLTERQGEDRGPAQFDRTAPIATRYDVSEADLVASPEVQLLLADRSLLALAQAYLGAAPVQDLVAMWWTTPSADSSGDAAQLFHFDLDRLRFVKLFVYLTDVHDTSGPHEYVRGTHRDLPRSLRADRRFADEEVLDVLGADRIARIVGPRGTMFLADTRGLHRGLRVERGHRLVFQMEWATSLFGRPVDRQMVASVHPSFRDVVSAAPGAFRRFVLEG